MKNVLVVIGSVTPPGRLRRAVEEGAERLGQAREVDVRLIDLADVTIAFADGRPPEQLGDDTATVVAAFEAADAVVLASPTYRGSLTGALKNLLDHVGVGALEGTPTGIVAIGATPHHFLGVDRHLRDVLAFHGAFVTPVSAYLTNGDFADGVPSTAAAGDVDALLTAVAELAELVGERPGVRFGGPRPLPRRA